MYLLLTEPTGVCPMAQKMSSYPALTQGWKKRLGKRYIACNLPVSEFFTGSGAGVEICDLMGDGVLSLASPSTPGSPITYYTAVCVTDDDTEMFLDAPGIGSRDAWAFFVEKNEAGVEILTRLNYRYVEAASLAPLESGEIVIEPGFHNAVFTTTAGTKLRYVLPENTRVILLNDNLEMIYTNAMPMLKPDRLPDGYILFCNDDGCAFHVEVQVY
jgi:hypothetical protein